jgi:hypothetical protein
MGPGLKNLVISSKLKIDSMPFGAQRDSQLAGIGPQAFIANPALH